MVYLLTPCRYHASGVEALSFFSGTYDKTNKEMLVLSEMASYFLLLCLVVAATLVMTLGDRMSGGRKGVLQYEYTYVLAF